MVDRGHIEQVLCSHNVQPGVYIRNIPCCDYLTSPISLNPHRRWQLWVELKIASHHH